jgi:1-deoxy-D-xylulose-5-phosphate reductoisomerase
VKKAIEKKGIAILGSTGSIGTQALEVIRAHPSLFQVEVLTAHNNVSLLIEQSRLFKPNAVVITNDDYYDHVMRSLDPLGIKVYCGSSALSSIVEMETIDMVLTALVGFTGLEPTLRAIQAGKDIALANKETMVVAGELVTRLARENQVRIIPVDSEHSAIFQCLLGEGGNPIEKVILTASGGPFRGRKRSFLEKVTIKEALAHPNWSMGAKITIDSATLMNKGLEVIEAKWLFGLKPEQIEVVIHPQSIIHSMVQFEDASIKAQLGLPDMRLPIQYALAWPERIKADFPRLDWKKLKELTFENPDLETFSNLKLAYYALEKGGNAPCALNAANEIAVAEFLQGNIGFLEMFNIIEECLANLKFISSPSFEDYVNTDKEIRRIAYENTL